MKKTLIIASVLALGAMVSQAQGLVSISLTAGNLVTTNSGGLNGLTTASGKAYGAAGATGFYYELLVSSSAQPDITSTSTGIGSWLDTGISGTAGTTGLNAGKITAGTSVPTTGSTWATP